MPRRILYEDLTLAIEAERDGGYRVRALSSPAGPAAAPFTLPDLGPALEDMIRRAGAGVRDAPEVAAPQAARDVVAAAPSDAGGVALREIGALLFRALFQGAVRTAYLWSRGRATSAADHGLRIRIVLPADIPHGGLLQSLPWELLYCEDTAAFLARDVLTPIVRILPLSCVSPPFPAGNSRRIRVLIVVAQPRGVAILDDADERSRILEAWCRRQSAEVRILRPATLRDLYEALRSEHYQVVHFIAHGNFDAATGAGSLLLETAEGAVHQVPGEVLAATLQASRELRLVFLNACRTARVGHRAGQDPLLAAAGALVRRGVQAVVAMQFPISDLAARIFSEAVYRSLARGSPIATAVADGRVALYQANPESWEWVTPALFAALTVGDTLAPLCDAAAGCAAGGEPPWEEISRLLRSGLFDRVSQIVESQLEGGVESADLHYYLALALLAGRRPRSLKPSEMRPVEASARQAMGQADCSAHHCLLMALLQEDFYLRNHLVPRPPSRDDLLARVAAAPRDAARLVELSDLLPWARPAVESVVGVGLGSEH